MSNYTFATIKIATQEFVDNTFILDWFKQLSKEETLAIKQIQLSYDKTHIDVHYSPVTSFDIDEILVKLSQDFPNTFVTIGHLYNNMQFTTIEYLVVFRNGEIIVDEKYPHAIIDEENRYDEDGLPNFDEEKSKEAISKLNKAKSQWFTTFDSSIDCDSEGYLTPKIIWFPNGKPAKAKEEVEQEEVKATKKSQYDIDDDDLPF